MGLIGKTCAAIPRRSSNTPGRVARKGRSGWAFGLTQQAGSELVE